MSVSKTYRIKQHHTDLEDESIEVQPFGHKNKTLANITVSNDSYTATIISVDLQKLIEDLQSILEEEESKLFPDQKKG